MGKTIIISATNRPNSNTLKVSKIYYDILKSKNNEAEILDLTTLPENISVTETYGKRSVEFGNTINKYITSNNQFIFVVPEYNGSFPGILKLFIDSIPPKEWNNKRACLVGVAIGRAGNLRGLDHLSAILSYLKMHVYYSKLPISGIDKLLNEQGKFISEEQFAVCTKQIDDFIGWI